MLVALWCRISTAAWRVWTFPSVFVGHGQLPQRRAGMPRLPIFSLLWWADAWCGDASRHYGHRPELSGHSANRWRKVPDGSPRRGLHTGGAGLSIMRQVQSIHQATRSVPLWECDSDRLFVASAPLLRQLLHPLPMAKTLAVLPGGQISGQKAQKGPEKKCLGGKILWPNFGRILSKVAKKGLEIYFCKCLIAEMRKIT